MTARRPKRAGRAGQANADLPALIRRHLAAHGLSQRGFAAAADIDHATIVRLLGSMRTDVTTATLRKFAAGLGMRVATLLGEGKR